MAYLNRAPLSRKTRFVQKFISKVSQCHLGAFCGQLGQATVNRVPVHTYWTILRLEQRDIMLSPSVSRLMVCTRAHCFCRNFMPVHFRLCSMHDPTPLTTTIGAALVRCEMPPTCSRAQSIAANAELGTKQCVITLSTAANASWRH